MAPVSPALSADLELSLDQMALVTSSTTAVAALLGLPASHVLNRLDFRLVLLGGGLLMGIAGFLGSLATDYGFLLGARLAESLGYLAVVMAAPVLIIGISDGTRRIAALAIWGTFLPVGLAVGSFGGGVLSAGFGWRWWITAVAVVTVIGAVAAVLVLGHQPARLPKADRAAGRPQLRRLGRPLLLALGLAMVSGTIVAIVSLMPTYLHETQGLSIAAAGTVSGAMSFIGVAGGFTGSWLLSRGVPARRVFLATLLMPVGAAIVFLDPLSVLVCLAGGVIITLANEFVISAIFASIPSVSSVPSDISLTNGLLTQLGSLGSLSGPPLVGLAVLSAGGWWAIVPSALAACALGTTVLRISLRPLAHRQSQG